MALALLVLLSACGLPRPDQPPETSLRPVPPAARPAPPPSARSAYLKTHFEQVEQDLVAQGLMRRDGGGPDTPYNSADLAETFEKVAFYDELDPGGSLQAGAPVPGVLRRWPGPVRIGIRFGPSVPQPQRQTDRREAARYVARLARVTGHSITMVHSGTHSAGSVNFHVLIMGEDDRKTLLADLDQIAPGLSLGTRSTLTHLPETVHCLVMGFADPGNSALYIGAVALIRAEEPPLTRLACLHEELAQGLGLRNDSDAARPSIFNDDNEFALLTSHDEKLLSILYDPRLQPGMHVEQARPLVWQIAAEQMGETPG